MSLLEIRDLQAGYRGRVVLDAGQLRFDAGLHFVVGENGAGKTTLFRVLSGVLPPMSGSVRIAGRDPFLEPAAKMLIGVSSHRAALAPRLSVEDNLGYWARVRGIHAAEVPASVARALARVDLADIRTTRAGILSRGQAQRVSLARALLTDPQVLLLDEPLSGVDPETSSSIRRYLKTLADTERAVIVSTHQLSEVSDAGGDVTLLERGRGTARPAPRGRRAPLLAPRAPVRIRGRGDLVGALDHLGRGYVAHSDADVVVDVPDERGVEEVVAALVSRGVGILEVRPADEPLNDLFGHLHPDTALDPLPALGDESARDAL